jgi:acetolactate synthase-1/3 small subunit
MKLLVDNEFGVLTRITARVRREGFNIKSLAVEVTENPEMSLMLIAVECLESALPKVLGRLNKLECVRKAEQVGSRFDLGMHLKEVFNNLDETEKDCDVNV